MLKRLFSLLTVRQQAIVAKGGKKQGEAAPPGPKAPSASRGAATSTGAKKRGGRTAADKLEDAATEEAEATVKRDDDPSKGPKRRSGRTPEAKDDAGGAGKRQKTRGGTSKGDTQGGHENQQTTRRSTGAEGK